jgi:hypothetical protein
MHSFLVEQGQGRTQDALARGQLPEVGLHGGLIIFSVFC